MLDKLFFILLSLYYYTDEEVAVYSSPPLGNPNQDFYFIPSQLIQCDSVRPAAVSGMIIFHPNDHPFESEKEQY